MVTTLIDRPTRPRATPSRVPLQIESTFMPATANARLLTFDDIQFLASGKSARVLFWNPTLDTWDPATIELDRPHLGKPRKGEDAPMIKPVEPVPGGARVRANVRTEFGRSEGVILYTTKAAEIARAQRFDDDGPELDREDLMVVVPAGTPGSEEVDLTPIAATSVNIVAVIEGMDDPTSVLERIQAVIAEEFLGHEVRMRKAQSRRLPAEYVDVVDENGQVVERSVLEGEASYVTPMRGKSVNFHGQDERR